MTAPQPWSGGLPWHDADFSERMLREHLNQSHGAASRPFPTIDRHVAWLHEEVLGGRPARVLDLGCGPGLYLERLAALGHTCTGIDFAPAPIAYARRRAAESGSGVEYRLSDIRTTGFGIGCGLVTFLFGDPDTVPPADIGGILGRAAAALAPGGRVVLEIHSAAAVEGIGASPPSARDLPEGLFAAGPHRLETRSWWDPAERIAVARYRVILPGGETEDHVVTTQHRGPDGYRALLASVGLPSVTRHSGYGTAVDPLFEVLVASAG